jgi:tetratricopeptide (TPR) repeat protein/energy-coupling factor transporter ATP-binding protein EcfA2
MNQQPVSSHEAPVHSRDQLPVRPPEKLYGRESDVTSVQLALKAGTAVLLHGSAGIGKTALAAALAADYAERPGGVLWLETNDDTTLSLLHRIVRAYADENSSPQPAPEALNAAVRDVLQKHRPLIVLDGTIRVEAAREFIRQCASSLPLLLTHPQLVGGSWTPHAVNPLAEDVAQAMLCELGGLPPDTEGLAELSAALGGHALSIFMASCQQDVQPSGFLAQMPDMPPGEANRIMGVLMASYRLLPKELQGMALLLGTTFAGGAGEELLADVSGAPGEVMVTRMRQLVERGFAYERTLYGQPYFVTHELIQVFARTFLRGKKQLDAMQSRHLKSLTTYVGRHVPAQHDQIAAEMPNIIAASLFAAETGQNDALNGLVSLLEAGDFAAARGFQAEVEWLRLLVEQPALAQAGILGTQIPAPPPAQPEAKPLGETPDTPAAVEAITPEPETLPAPEVPPEPASLPETESVSAEPSVNLPTDAESLRRIGQEATTEGDAIARYTAALEGYKADGNVEDELAAMEALAMLNLESENYEAVLAYVDQGTALAQDIDNPQREGRLLIILGDLQVTLGRWEGAEVAYQEAINALQPSEAWLDMGLTLDKLGVLYLEQDRAQEAITTWQQAISYLQRAGRSDLVRTVYGRLGAAYSELMMWDRAQTNYAHALELAQTAQDDQAIFEELNNLGTLMEASGRRDDAALYYRRALHYAFKLDDQPTLGAALLALARLLIDDTTQLHRAVQVLEAAQTDLPDNPEVQRLLGRAKTRQTRLSQAGVTLPQAQDSLEDYAQSVTENA